MNIFGIGGAELVLIILIMLVVAGPQRMIRWAYHLGRYTSILRKQWAQMMEVVQKEIDAAGMDVQVPRDLPTRQNLSKFIQDAAKPLSDPVQDTIKEVTDPVKEAMGEVQKVQSEANAELQQANKQLKQVGTWNGSKAPAKPQAEQPEQAAADADKKPSPEGNFGAWSVPEHPGQQSAQEQQSS